MLVGYGTGRWLVVVKRCHFLDYGWHSLTKNSILLKDLDLFVYTHLCAHSHSDQRKMLGVLYHSLPYFHKIGFPREYVARMMSSKPWILPSLSPQFWG